MPAPRVAAKWNTPKSWLKRKPMTLFHGTTLAHLPSIRQKIDWTKGKTGTDFGPGFYVTTLKHQAKSWAWDLAQIGTDRGVVIVFEAHWEAIAALESLCFVRGDYKAEEFWSFVFHCRKGASDHGRPGSKPFFDVVFGPVAAQWWQRSVMGGADQLSFHCDAVNKLLLWKDEIVL